MTQKPLGTNYTLKIPPRGNGEINFHLSSMQRMMKTLVNYYWVDCPMFRSGVNSSNEPVCASLTNEFGLLRKAVEWENSLHSSKKHYRHFEGLLMSENTR